MAATASTYRCDDCGAPATVVVDDPDLGERGAFELVCSRDCGWTQYVPAETTEGTRIAALRAIVDECSAQRIDGVLVDLFTASMLVKVHDALTRPTALERFETLPLPQLVNICWKLVK